MREEVISSGGTVDPATAASSAGASSPAVPMNVGSIDGSSHGQGSKAASLSCVGSQPPWTDLSTSAGGSAFGSSRSSSCRPWERGDLLRRLATFAPLNWFAKPQTINSLACGQKGWTNIGVDKIVCESCGACLSFTSSSSWTSAEAQDASESFARQLDSGHKVNCPWKGNSCPESLVHFPPTPQSALIGGYKDRCDGLIQFHYLPVVAISAIELMCVSRGPQIERFLSQPQNFMSGVDFKPEIMSELESSQDEAYCLFTRAQKLISLCGWEPRWLLNVQDCEEHSAQSERNGYSFGPGKTQLRLTQDPGPKAVSTSTKMAARKEKAPLKESILDYRSPMLDCSLCGATVKISDFLTVPRPTRFASNSIDIPDTSKKIGLTRGVSAASGISGWIAADDTEKDQTEDRDEVATTNEGKLLANTGLDLNLTMAGSFRFTPLGRTATSENTRDEDMGRDLMIGQPSGSEIGDRAASYESRGPSSRKRNLEKGGSSDDRPVLRLQQQADSVEGTVIDRDGDEVTDCGQYSAGPSKRARDSDIFDTYCSPRRRDFSGAGPSHSLGFEGCVAGNRVSSFHQGSDRLIGIQSARESTRASSVIAMDTICHSVNDDSMESVENHPGDFDDVHFPSSSTYGNVDMNETSELNNSNQAQTGEAGVSSTNYGEELFNAETVTVQARDGISFGISGGSVGMCASHEAEIHGADISVHRTDTSVVGEMEHRLEDAENQGQTGESVPDPGLMGEIIPNDINREDPIGDSQEMMMMSHSAGRADSGSKIGCSTKAESVESGEKISQNCKLPPANSSHPSRSCNANIYSGYANTKEEIMKEGKSSFTNNCAPVESDFAIANGIGPSKGESNYEEAVEFDPIIYHNQYCPWVNGNVAAAGSTSSVPSTSSDAIALCGWQLTLDALDVLRSLGNNAIPTVQSESAASLYKNDEQAPREKLLRNHSMSRSHGQL